MTDRLLSLIASLALFCALIAAAGCGGLGKSSGEARGSSTGAGGSGTIVPVPGGAPITPSNAGDKYKAVGTNPFVASAYDPLSTFAVDVDTASYDIFRRDVNLGLLPQPASVRLEEHVNNFDYAYPTPTTSDAHPFKISLAAAGDMFHRETTLLRVGIAAREPVPFEKRPANVVFLVDVSGSMA